MGGGCGLGGFTRATVSRAVPGSARADIFSWKRVSEPSCNGPAGHRTSDGQMWGSFATQATFAPRTVNTEDGIRHCEQPDFDFA
jgi:hypothetical protein